MNSSPDDKVDDLGFIERCGNPSHPTYWVSAFLFTSWFLTYLIPPLLPGHRTLTWGDVMKLNMGWIEGLQFALFSTFALVSLVLYALTNEEGGELNDSLQGLVNVAILNYGFLGLLVIYKHIVEPTICRPSTRSHASTSVTSQDSIHSPNASGNTFNVL